MHADAAIPRRHSPYRIARDFVLGIFVYALLLTGATLLPQKDAGGRSHVFATSAHASVHAVVAGPAAEATKAANRDQGSREATFILGLAFASLTALNLAFLRHLRRVYASPR
jgi:hypothetical protein